MHGIERVEKAIIAQAERKAAEIVAEAQRRAGEILAKSDEEANALERKTLGEAERQAELVRERALADARMQASNELVAAKNKAFDAVFEVALAQLVSWKKKKPNDYRRWVSKLVAKAARGKSGVELVFASDDAKLFKAVQPLSKFKTVFSNDLSGGVIVRLPGENVEVDESFEQKIANARVASAVEVARVLFGGKKKTKKKEEK
ncbi:MAG: V-type ATP synthase subunit E family protein [Candidatus Norongarragalinales archaeon]